MTDFQKQFFFDDMDYKCSCKDKTTYDNIWQARFAIDECYQMKHVALSCYKCKYCGKWHLTSRKEV